MGKNKQRLAEMLEERDRHLAIHPELKPTQKNIEKKLEKAGPDKAKRAQAVVETIAETTRSQRSASDGEVANVQRVLAELRHRKGRSNKSEKPEGEK